MKKISLVLGLLAPIFLNAQNILVRGNVSDTSTGRKLTNALVNFLKESDSTLVTFVRTNQYGDFEKSIPAGSYIVLFTSPNYADYVIKIEDPHRAELDLGSVPMTSKAKLLAEIIITQQAIRIKGDTTEYVADSFRVKPNASVQDLLKQLPGIQVDKNGTITAQGKTVHKILVDGDEFFSDDPTIATQNLRADAVKKVQVFDKKSDEAEFTGVDDGQRTKTINLELKDDARNGYFGKLAAAGLNHYYNLQAMINEFKEKRKLAAFAIGSSTSETGLDWQNAENYGFNSGVTLSEETGGIMISSAGSGDLGSGNFDGTGLPESVKAGVHFSNKWNEDKTDLAANYLFNNLKVRNRGQSLTKNILDEAVYFSNTSSQTRSDRLANELSGVLEVTIDSTSSVKVNAGGTAERDKYYNHFESENVDDLNNPINSSTRSTEFHVDNANEFVNGIYRKRLRKPGQTFSISVSQAYRKSNSNGLLFNAGQFFDLNNGNGSVKDTIDQSKTSDNRNISFSAGATFTQPLSPVSFLVFNYSFVNNNTLSERLTYDKGAPNHLDQLNDSLSNKFSYIYNIHKAGVNYRYVKSKISASFGGSASYTEFDLKDFFRDTKSTRNYINFYPGVAFDYKFNAYRNLRFNYDGSSVQPTIDQIQPVINNIDPLNVFIGNPGLKQSFVHNFEFFFTDVKVLTERYIFAGANLSITNNEINESYFLDTLGRRISQFVNTNGNYNARIFAMVNVKFPNSIMRFGAGPLVQLYRYSNVVSLKNSVTNTSTLRIRLTLQGRVPEKFDFSFAAMPGYNLSRSSISKISDQNYWDADITANGSYELPSKFEIGTDITAGLRQKIATFDKNNNIISWNAYIEKRFLKNESLTLRASIFDILNQNKGYFRYQLATGIQEQHYQTWGQYGLISVTYNFVKKGSKGPENMNGGFTF